MENGSITPIQTKRGCSCRCAYCSYPALEGGAVRPRDPGEVCDEIARLKNDLGVPFVFFSDSVFNDEEGHYRRAPARDGAPRAERPLDGLLPPRPLRRRDDRADEVDRARGRGAGHGRRLRHDARGAPQALPLRGRGGLQRPAPRARREPRPLRHVRRPGRDAGHGPRGDRERPVAAPDGRLRVHGHPDPARHAAAADRRGGGPGRAGPAAARAGLLPLPRPSTATGSRRR